MCLFKKTLLLFDDILAWHLGVVITHIDFLYGSHVMHRLLYKINHCEVCIIFVFDVKWIEVYDKKQNGKWKRHSNTEKAHRSMF